jgi:hypothetical protein
MPTVSEFIVLESNFSMMTFVPVRVVNCGCSPVVIGMVRSSSPLLKTFIWCDAMSTL